MNNLKTIVNSQAKIYKPFLDELLKDDKALDRLDRADFESKEKKENWEDWAEENFNKKNER